MTTQDVRTFLVGEIVRQLEFQGRDIGADDITDDCDLVMSGLIDSLGVLELTSALDDHCGFELDFEALDPEQMTIVGPLCEFVALQIANHPS